MGLADAYNAYLQKHAIGGQLISETPDPKLHTIIAIPAYNESGLTTCLDSLFHCDPPLAPAEVIVLINSAKSSSREIVAANRRSYAEVTEWIEHHQTPCYRPERSRAASHQPDNNPDSHLQESKNHGQDQSKPQEKLRFHVVLVEDLPDKHFGAGLARKLVMDEAVRRLAGRAAGNQIENGPAGAGAMGRKVEQETGRARGSAPGQSAEKDIQRATRRAAPGQSAEQETRRAHKGKINGIIVSLDADTVVRADYLRAVEDHFSRHPEASGCSISFEHPLSLQEYENQNPQNPPPENFPPEAFEAVTNYELHQRYYLLAVRYTGYPYAYHTVGSCFAVQVEAYCRAGGMSRRQAGEDFYFIQKLAVQGGFTECRSTRVYPSPRPSDRVPFGTGPDITRQICGGQLDASAKHPNNRDSYGAGQDSRQLPPYLTYHPELFEHLRMFFELIPRLCRSGKAPASEPNGDRPAGTKGEAPEDNATAAKDGDPPVGTKNTAVPGGVPPVLDRYLEESGFWEELKEIRGNTASEGAFRKRFFNKFNMFWILKYLHFAEEHGVEKMEVTAAAGMMLEMWERVHGSGTPGIPTGSSTREMLLFYRNYFERTNES
jgi:hypothetical protein